MAPTPKPQAVKKAADSPGLNGSAPKSGAKDLTDNELKQLKSGGAKAKVAHACSHSRRSPRPPRTPHGHAPCTRFLARAQRASCVPCDASCCMPPLIPRAQESGAGARVGKPKVTKPPRPGSRSKDKGGVSPVYLIGAGLVAALAWGAYSALFQDATPPRPAAGGGD